MILPNFEVFLNYTISKTNFISKKGSQEKMPRRSHWSKIDKTCIGL